MHFQLLLQHQHRSVKKQLSPGYIDIYFNLIQYTD
jgi:hypothetical protein